jgi:hypothetical protein
MDDQVFVVSELTIDVADVPGGRILRFNGTTEWALDSVDADGGGVAAARGASSARRWAGRSAGWSASTRASARPAGPVVVAIGGRERREIDVDAERAYARSVLALLGA